MRRHKVIGVLGGMGPAATVEFFRRVVVATPATIDQAHHHILIDDNPRVPDRTRALLHGGESPVPAMVAMAQRLETAGAELLTMPCNTAHAFIGDLRSAVGIPFLDMIEETVRRLDVECVGLLSTTATIKVGIYSRACRQQGKDLLAPKGADQETVVRAIEAVKASRDLTEVTAAVRRVVDRLRAKGARTIIAGCTEISLLDGTAMPLPWIDALDCLVDATLREATVPEPARDEIPKLTERPN